MEQKIKYDVFISYRRDTGWLLARVLNEALTAKGLNVFLDVDELVTGEFDTKIYDCIEQSANFIFILSEHSLDRCINPGDWVSNEIIHALKLNKRIIPVYGSPVDIPKQLPKEMERFPYLQRHEISPSHFQSTIDELIKKLYFPTATKKSDINTYYKTYKSETEEKRLKAQSDITRLFDWPTYKKVIDKYDQLTILDVGSGQGDKIFDRFGKENKVNKIICIDYNKNSIEVGSKRFGSDKIKFYELNIEAEDFEEKLKKITEENNVKFNVIHAAVLLMHVSDPQKLLRILYKFLVPGGTIIVEETDDGFDVAHPDPQGIFKKLDHIARQLHDANACGYRGSGRRMLKFLKLADFKNIQLEGNGLNTINLNSEQRSTLFNADFGFIKERVAQFHEKYPDNAQWAENFQWINENWEAAKEMYQSHEFFYSSGWMIFTATKE